MLGFKLNKRVLNVTLIFFLAYFTIHLFYLFTVYFCASFIGVKDVRMYFSYVAYDLTDFEGWSRLKIIVLFGIPTMVMPVLSVLFWLAKKNLPFGNNPKMTLFYLNLILISLSFFIADFITAPFKRQGIALVAEWFYLKKEIVLGMSFLLWALIPAIAKIASSSYMKLAYSRMQLRSKWTRASFLIVNVIQGFVIAAVIMSMMIISVPAYTATHYFGIDFIRFVVIFLILVFIVLFNFNKKFVGIKKSQDLGLVDPSFVIFTLGVGAVIYLVLLF